MADPIVVKVPPLAIPGAKPPEPPAPVAATLPPEPKPEVLKEQFEALTRKERALLAEKQKAAEEKRAFDEERAKYKADLEEAAKIKAMFAKSKESDELVRSLYGEDYFKTFAEWNMEKKPPPDLRVDAVKDEIEKLKQELAKRDKDAAEERKQREQEEQQATVERFKAQVGSYLKSQADKYKLLNKEGAYDTVHQVIHDHWYEKQKDIPETERKLLSVDDAAKMVEDWLVARAKEHAELLGLTNATAYAQTPARKTPEGSPRETRTLSSDLPGTSAPRPPPLTEKEREQRAFAAYDAVVNQRRKPGV